MMRTILIFALFFCFEAQAKKTTKRKSKITYQKRQMIDLGALLIDGELVTPGDFSIEDEKEKASNLIYKRKNYNDRLRINIEYVF